MGVDLGQLRGALGSESLILSPFSLRPPSEVKTHFQWRLCGLSCIWLLIFSILSNVA